MSPPLFFFFCFCNPTLALWSVDAGARVQETVWQHCGLFFFLFFFLLVNKRWSWSKCCPDAHKHTHTQTTKQISGEDCENSSSLENDKLIQQMKHCVVSTRRDCTEVHWQHWHFIVWTVGFIKWSFKLWAVLVLICKECTLHISSCFGVYTRSWEDEMAWKHLNKLARRRSISYWNHFLTSRACRYMLKVSSWGGWKAQGCFYVFYAHGCL